MPPTVIIAIVFGGLAVVAAWAIQRDLVSGVAGDSLYRFRADTNPAGYVAVLAGKMVVVLLGVAEILHAFGIAGDPMRGLRVLFG